MIVKKTPAEIDAMAKAGEIHVRTMDLIAGKIRATERGEPVAGVVDPGRGY